METANHLAAARVFLNEAVKLLAQTTVNGASRTYLAKAEANIDAAQGAIGRAMKEQPPPLTEMQARVILAEELEKSAPKIFLTVAHLLRDPAHKVGSGGPNSWPAVIAAMFRASLNPST